MGNYRDHLGVVIVNDPLTLDFSWHLEGAELDNISMLVKGSKTKKKVKSEELSHFLAGVLDGLVVMVSDHLTKREVAAIGYSRAGHTEAQVASYLRGWDSVNQIIEERSKPDGI